MHEVQLERALRRQLPGNRGDLDALEVVEQGQLVVDHLDGHMSGVSLDEARVHDVVRVDVAAAFVLGLLIAELELRLDRLHRAPGARDGESDVVAIHQSRAPVESLVVRIADEAQPNVRLVRNVAHGALQLVGIARGNHGLPVFELESRDPSPRRIVDPGHQLGAGGIRAQLRLVGELLQGIVVPELHFDAPIQRAALVGLVRREGRARPAAVAGDRRGRQVECILHRQGDPKRARLRQREVRAVDAFGSFVERKVIGESNELDRHVLLVAEVVERFAHLSDKVRRDLDALASEMQRRDQVLHPSTVRVTLAVAQLAKRFRSADLDPLDLLGNDDLLGRDLLADLVVPDLDLDAPVARSSLGSGVGGNRLGVAGPRKGDGLGRKSQRRLDELSNLTSALSGESSVVSVDPGEATRQRLIVGMADHVEPNVVEVSHTLENDAQPIDVASWNVGDAGLESDRRHDVRELDRVRLQGEHVSLLELVSRLAFEQLRIASPERARWVARHVPLDRLAERGLHDFLGRSDRRHQEEPRQNQASTIHHGHHLFSGGAPRRQNTSGSIVSS